MSANEKLGYAWSDDQEHYEGEASSPLGAAEDGFAKSNDARSTIWVGRMVRPPAESLIDADTVLDAIAADDAYSLECAEDWPRASKEQRAELAESLRRVVGEWLDRHDLRGFFLVEDVVEYVRDEGGIHPARVNPRPRVAPEKRAPDTPGRKGGA